MEVRCQNCGERIVTKPVAAEEYQVTCSACGRSMTVVPKVEKARPRGFRFQWPERRHGREDNFRRVYSPIPQVALYAAGVVVALVLLSPFWVSLLQDRQDRANIFLSPETTNFVATTAGADTNLSVPLFGEATLPTTSLDGFRGIKLDTGRDELLRRFNLRLQNTRGMEPEIYAAYRLGEAEHISGYFYNNLLKEAFLVFRESRQGLATLQQELFNQFGPPVSQADSPNRAVTTTGLPTTLGGVDEAGELERKIGAIPYRRDYVWASDNFRVEATIYYQALETNHGAMLSVHLSAAAWLRANQPMGGVIVAPNLAPANPNATNPRDLLR